MFQPRMLTPRIGLTILVLASGPGLGAQPSRLPADVETVLTGGFWEAAGQEGRYRVVIRSAGFEHLISTMTVDWILNATETDSARVLASLPVPVGPVALHDPDLSRERDGYVLAVMCTDDHYDSPRRDTVRVRLGLPGVMSVSRPPACSRQTGLERDAKPVSVSVPHPSP